MGKTLAVFAGKISDFFILGGAESPDTSISNQLLTDPVFVLGPKQYNHPNGAPVTYNETFPLSSACTNVDYKLRIFNGEANGSNRVPSGEVVINGVLIYDESDFNQQFYTLERTVNLTAVNTLQIKLSGTNGGYVNLQIANETCIPPDTTAPALAIIAPANNSATTESAIAFSGTADDPGTPASGIAQVTVNGGAVSYNSITKIWEASSVSLSPGANTLTARAVDNAGNETSAQVTVIRDTTAPSVSITSPASDTNTQGATVTVSGSASDGGPDSSGINRVTLNGADAVFDAATGLWSLANVPLTVGANTLTAVAFDRAGNQTSAQITVNRVVNQPPQVGAGVDQTVYLPNSATLSGTASDDGLPAGNSLTTAWSVVSGPGTVTFGNAASAATTATFSATGAYQLKLEATDSELTASDLVNVQVNPPANAPIADFAVPQMGGPVALTALSNSSSSSTNTPANLLDESRTTMWTTVSGQNVNQWAKFEVLGGSQLIDKVKLQQPNVALGQMVKDFQIQVSSKTTADADFYPVLSGVLLSNDQLQQFAFPAGAANAKYVKLVALNNYSGTGNLSLGTFQVVGAGGADSIVSLPGTINVARSGSPSSIEHGGSITRYSSANSTPVALIAGNAIWQTKSTTNEFAVIKLGGDDAHLLRGFRIAANYGDYTNHWVKDFEVWVSSTIDFDGAFVKVLDGVKTGDQTQDFLFTGGPVWAKYVKYVPKSSRGGLPYISTPEIEVLTPDGGVFAFSGDGSTTFVEEAFDNDLNTSWYAPSNQTTNQWVKIRLDGAGSQRVYGVRIAGITFGSQSPKDYQIRISNTTPDDAAFNVVQSGTLAVSSAYQEIRFAQPVDAKYVQFYWVNGHSTSWIGVRELEVLALPADGAMITSVTGQGEPSLPLTQLLDLNQSGQGWSSVDWQNVNQKISLRLFNGEQFGVNHVALRPYWTYAWGSPQTGMSPKDFDVQVSTTDTADASFTTVYSGTMAAVDRLQHFYFPAAQARFIRLVLKNNYGHSQMMLSSFFVYAEKTGSTAAKFYGFASDPDNDIVSYDWDFGDGTTGSGVNPSHTYAAAGLYNVTLSVTDASGLVTTVQKEYRALPAIKADFAFAPTSTFESDSSVMAVYFSDLSSARLRIGGGKVTSNAFTHNLLNRNFATYTYPDNGNFPATLQFGEDYVLNYRTTKTVPVVNLPPLVNINDGKTVYWGESWTNALITLTDPGPNDRSTLSGVWNFGNGLTASCTNCTTATALGTHAYAAPGNYTAVFTVTDKDGGAASDSAVYTVIKRPTKVVFQPLARAGDSLTVSGTLRDTYGNLPIAGKPVQLNVNGYATNLTTNAGGNFTAVLTLPAAAPVGSVISYFAEDDFYQSSSNIYSAPTDRENPPASTPSNGGTDFWVAFPANAFTGTIALLITSDVNTSGTIASACGVNQTYQVTAKTVTRITVPAGCQLQTGDQVQNLGIRVTAQNPVVVFGLNERTNTTDAFLALPVNTLGQEYYALAYTNTAYAPSSQFGVVATANNTTVTIKPSVTVGARQKGVDYQITLNQGQTYLYKTTEVGVDKDVTGSLITSDKPVAVFGGHQAATLPAPTVCCADHLVEQMPPVNTWGKRFVLVASATRTKGDFFRFVAAYDNTVLYLNGERAATLAKGQYFEKLIKDSTEAIATEPIMVGQFATSSGFDTSTYGADPFMAIVPPYSQYLNHYTIATPNRLNNFVNLSVPTAIVGQVLLNGNPVAASNFTAIGGSGFSSARIPVSMGTHNLDAPAPFGVISYGYGTDEGYGFPGGMSLIATVRGTNLTLTPETAAFGINSEACVTATLKDQDNLPLGGKTVNLSVTGANPQNASGTTSVSGHYGFCYTGTNTGSDTITAVAENITTSATFIWSPPNSAPTVDAGIDQTVTLPGNADLSATVADDGYPTNALTSVWSKVSGSGNVTFADANNPATTAAFSVDGVYILRLTASDGQYVTTDDITVSVAPEPPNTVPTVNAGDDQIIKISANLIKNPGAEEELVDGELSGWTETAGSSWTRAGAVSGNVPPARFGAYVITSEDAVPGELRQDIDVRAFSQGIGAGTQSFEWKAYLRSGLEETADSGRIVFEYRDAANQNTLATLDSGEIATIDGWHLTEDTRAAPAGTGFIRIRLIATRRSGTTTDVFFDGLSLRAVGNVAAVKLNGAATDDGLPSGSTLQKTWTKISGSGNVTFADPGAVDSAAVFDAAGTYVLRLAATDGQLSAEDEMTVTVEPANAAPTVNAGTDRTVTLPSTVQLGGAASDDGGAAALSARWTKVSGAGIVSFNNPAALNPTVSFSLAGTYVLRLTANDGELEASDEMTVTVNAAPTNQPPTVETGGNQTITLPTASLALGGAVTDDGLPSGNLSINWSKTSGAGSVTFANATDPATTAVFGAAGSYILRLTASDGNYTVWKEKVVTVYPEGGGGTNQPPTVGAGADQTLTLEQTAILEAVVSDDGLPAGGSFSAQWTKVSGDGTVSFSNPAQTATYATFNQTGTYVLRLTVSDSELSASDDVTVTVVENQPAPTVEILTPVDGASAFEPTAITGTVSGGAWTLDYSYNDSDNLASRAWTTVASGTGAASGTLGTLDTTLMLNGLYDVRLTSVDEFGRGFYDIISVSVERNLKIGHFTVSFDDMSVPVAGIPIQVVRTYDSRDKRKGDFGMGWTLSLKNARVQKSAVLGLKWYQTKSNTFIPTYCVEPTKPHIVTVTMPGGAVEKFEAKLQQQCQQAAPLVGGNLVFTPQGTARGKLEVVGSNELAIAGSVPGPVELIAYDGTGIFDRATFKYTAKDGTEFVINQGGGLQSVRDTNGNTLTISANGITHSSGKSVTFTRDAQGRITHITDPAGKSNVYTYDAGGDLVSYKDREENTTSFTYEPTIAHHLKTIVDPLNRTPIRNEYDASGRLLKHVDANGNEIVYTHNLAQNIEVVTDRMGHSTTFEYDARGNVLKKRDALNNETVFSYDANDNVLTETNALGKTTTFTYDAQDNRTSVTDPLGNKTEMTYNLKGQVLTVKDARGNVTTNTYDTAGNLLTSKDALNNLTTNVYSIQTGQLTSTKDALNHVTTFEYVGNYLVKQTDAQGNETTFTYDANGNRKTQTVKRTNAAGQLETITTTFEFDNLNRVVKSIQPDGSFTRTEYNELGQQAATVDQGGNRTEFTYDDSGRLIKTTYADGKFEESTFDDEGRRLTSKDRSGKVTTYQYDALGRLKKTIYADNTFTGTTYDAAGQVVTSTDARGNATVYTYDDAGRRLSVKNALNQVTSFTYDATGNQLTMTDALNQTTTNVYDTLNRKTKTVFADNSFVETTFDELGRRTAEKDQAGKVTQFVYDSLGRLTKVKDALNQETSYEYNELGQQTKQIDALNRETKYEYDQLGRRAKRILPLGQTETYAYDADGNLQSKTDFNGKTTVFAYDDMRRLLSKTPDASLNQPAVSYTYNALGQRATMTDASGTTVYGYDDRNRLATKQTPFGTLAYTYDDAGNIETLRSSNANGVSVDYDYDELNRLSSVKDNRLTGNQTTNYTFDAVGNLQSYSYPNQVTTSYAYNNLNRLTTMTVSNASGGLASYAYTLGASGNRTAVTEGTGRTVNYVYDDLYRLTQETIANSANNGVVNYQYDAVGNRLQRTSNVNQVTNQSSTFDANDRLNSDTYDANGNTKLSNGKTYNYDFENKLTQTSDGVTIVYDGDGNRVAKTVGGVTTNYLVDTNNLTGYAQVVEELQNGQVTKQYTYGLDLISQKQGAITSFYNYDGHGSVRNLTDSTGQITDIYDYDAFGTIVNRTGTTENNYLYAGEQFDADLGFYYNRARYLNVQTGRFFSMDSFEGNSDDPLSLHKYLYGANDAVNKIDPSGNEFTIIGKIMTALVVGILATIAVPPILNKAFYGLFGGAGNVPEISIETQPIIVEGGGWNKAFAEGALNEAADFWWRWGRIKVNLLSTIHLTGLPVKVENTFTKKGIEQDVLRAKLAERGLSPKHTSIFLDVIKTPVGGSAYGQSVAGSSPHQTIFGTSALNYSNLTRSLLRFPASQTIAHEWGHSFGLDHTFLPGLMSSEHSIYGIPTPLDQTYYQNILSGREIGIARNGAQQYQ